MRTAGARILIAGTASGCGKTTITCGLMRALLRRGLAVHACKCGPDFIDPRFHEQVVGVPSSNLDLFLGSRALACELLAAHAATADISVLEGVMGYFDGIAGTDEASSFDVARTTHTPTILVVDARGRSLSAAAEVAGFARFREPSQLAGVLLNRASAAHFPTLKGLIEQETGLAVLGYLPEIERARLDSRHLGLVGATEVANLAQKVDAVADALETCCDLDALLRVAASAEMPPRQQQAELPRPVAGRPLVAVARDEAFQFYYDDALALLERLGARLLFFSPLRDQALPTGSSGLYLGGGYPELHARELSENVALRHQIASAIASGLPAIAECGGFLYLHETLEDDEGTPWPLVGTIRGRARKGTRLRRFGYATLTARSDSLLASAGDSLRAHEFHYWQSDEPGSSFRAEKPRNGRSWDCVHATPTLYAGFPHLYLPGCPEVATRFLAACAAYATRGEAL